MIDNLSSLITRIEDLPYYYSPPLQFTFSQTANLTAAQYPFTGARAVVGNNKNITDNTLLYIKAISFSADVELLAYQSGLKLATGTVDIPRFSLFTQADANAPIFIDPIQLGDYFNNQEFKKIVYLKQLPNNLTGFFRGTVQQNTALAGVIELTLTINIWVQAISDDNFIQGLKEHYPNTFNRISR